MKTMQIGRAAIGCLLFLAACETPYATEDDLVTKEDLPEMIYVSGGTFTMGENSGQRNEFPAHLVTVHGFYLSKTEVTNEQYVLFLNRANMGPEAYSSNDKDYNYEASWLHRSPYIEYVQSGWRVKAGYEKYPVVNVTWYGAKAYCEWANGRLPTESEWEYAARGGNKTRGYPYAGDTTLTTVAWYSTGKENWIHEVATKKPNELGLYDMSGNAAEWCSDWLGDYPEDPQYNPSGSITGQFRVLRGSGPSSQNDCRVSARLAQNPSYLLDYGMMGFRLLLPQYILQ